MGTPLQQPQQPLMLSGDDQLPMLPNDGMGIQNLPSHFKDFLSEFSELTLTEFITIFSQISGTDPLSLSRDAECNDLECNDDDDDDDDGYYDEQSQDKHYRTERQFLHEIFNSVTISELMDFMSGDLSSAFKVHVIIKNWIFRVIGEGIEPTNEQIAKFVDDFSKYIVTVDQVPQAILDRLKRPYTPDDVRGTIKDIVSKYFDVTIKKILCVEASEASIRGFLDGFFKVFIRLFVRELMDTTSTYFIGGIDDIKKTIQYFLYVSFKYNHKEINSYINFMCYNFSEFVVQNLMNVYHKSCQSDPNFSYNFDEVMKAIYEEEAEKDEEENVFSIDGSGLRFRFIKKDVDTLISKWRDTVTSDMKKIVEINTDFCFTENYKNSLNFI